MEIGNKAHTVKKDLRVKKTQKALFDVLFTMLGSRNFNEITVNDLCAQAFVSRATFYSHFNDKYSLLKYFLREIKESVIKDGYEYNDLEREINGFIEKNKRVITNLFRDANSETFMHIREFMSTIAERMIKRKVDSNVCPHHTILFNFFAGGLANLLMCIVERNFPPNNKMMNAYLYEMLEVITSWDAQQGGEISDV